MFGGLFMKPGFIPALGTPLTNDGELCVGSFKTQIEQQIEAGVPGDGAALSPNYLRLSQAERERLAREEK